MKKFLITPVYVLMTSCVFIIAAVYGKAQTINMLGTIAKGLHGTMKKEDK